MLTAQGGPSQRERERKPRAAQARRARSASPANEGCDSPGLPSGCPCAPGLPSHPPLLCALPLFQGSLSFLGGDAPPLQEPLAGHRTLGETPRDSGQRPLLCRDFLLLARSPRSVSSMSLLGAQGPAVGAKGLPGHPSWAVLCHLGRSPVLGGRNESNSGPTASQCVRRASTPQPRAFIPPSVQKGPRRAGLFWKDQRQSLLPWMLPGFCPKLRGGHRVAGNRGARGFPVTCPFSTGDRWSQTRKNQGWREDGGYLRGRGSSSLGKFFPMSSLSLRGLAPATPRLLSSGSAEEGGPVSFSQRPGHSNVRAQPRLSRLGVAETSGAPARSRVASLCPLCDQAA